MTVARAGPASAISAKNTRNAIAVQITASPAIDHAAGAVIRSGHSQTAKGAYRTVATINDPVTTPVGGRAASRRVMMVGPIAYPSATSITAPTQARASP